MNEYISRKAVYQFAKDHKEKETGAFSKGYNKGLRVMMAAVMNEDAIPSADVRPVVRSKWKRIDYVVGHDYTCGNCYDKNDRASNFCPCCGADMRPRPKEETI